VGRADREEKALGKMMKVYKIEQTAVRYRTTLPRLGER
jgi:hypothetical protein